MTDDQTAPPAIDGAAGWRAAVLWGVAAATAAPARTITWVDPRFEAWPLDDPALLERLTRWIRLPQRRLVLLAADFGEVPRRHPRFTAWRRDHQHAIHALQVPDELAPGLPSLMHDDGEISVHLIDDVHWRGRAQRDTAAAWRWREQTDVFAQRSSPAFAVTTLGL